MAIVCFYRACLSFCLNIRCSHSAISPCMRLTLFFCTVTRALRQFPIVEPELRALLQIVLIPTIRYPGATSGLYILSLHHPEEHFHPQLLIRLCHLFLYRALAQLLGQRQHPRIVLSQLLHLFD